MSSNISHEQITSIQNAPAPQSETERRAASLGDTLDDIAIFTFVAIAVVYIALATYGLW
jgi:hypothetical protein